MSSWYESRPIAVEGGVKAKSQRGDIGTQWWSRRFIAVLQSYGIASRLTRGKAYARKGQVMEFSLGVGAVTALVQGSRPKPYKVTIKVLPLTTAQWKTVADRLAGAAIFRAKLLAGEMPAEIEEVFDSCGTPLFPRRLSDLDMRCSCPDSAVPCKHLAAVCYVLAESFDDDPFEMLAWRGRGREELLAPLRRGGPAAAPDPDPDGPDSATLAVLGDVTGPSLATSARNPADFWSSGLSAARLRSLASGEATAETAPDLLLRMFEPPEIKVRGQLLRDILAPAYERFAAED